MSTNPDKGQDPPTPAPAVVTDDVLAFALDISEQRITEKLQAEVKKQFDSFMVGLEQKLSPLVDIVNQDHHILQQAMQGAQAQQAQGQGQERTATAAGPRQKIDIKELIEGAKEVLGVLREAGIIHGEAPSQGVDPAMALRLQSNLNQIYNRAIKVAGQATENVLHKEIRIVSNSMARDIASQGIVDHEPVL